MGKEQKKGIITLVLCFTLWGFQPLYWALCGEMDTFFLWPAG